MKKKEMCFNTFTLYFLYILQKKKILEKIKIVKFIVLNVSKLNLIFFCSIL